MLILKTGNIIRYKSYYDSYLFLVLNNFESKVTTVCIDHPDDAGPGVISTTSIESFENSFWEIIL
mgnify:CR=1 FL=1